MNAHVAGSAIAVSTMASFTGGFVDPVVAGWLIDPKGSYLGAFGLAIGLAAIGVCLAAMVPEP